jgi:hypothetical protein
MASTKGGKNRAAARQAVKNARRRARKGMKPWMRGKPMMKTGMGGTDKSHWTGRTKRAGVYYSDKPASKK